METWVVTENKWTWDRETRTWTTQHRVIATGLTRGQVDRYLQGHPDRSASPRKVI